MNDEDFAPASNRKLLPTRLGHLAVNAEGFVFDPRTGDSFMVNQTGLTVMRGLQRGDSEAAIEVELTERFDVAVETARQDMGDFVNQLRHLQIL